MTACDDDKWGYTYKATRSCHSTHVHTFMTLSGGIRMIFRCIRPHLITIFRKEGRNSHSLAFLFQSGFRLLIRVRKGSGYGSQQVEHSSSIAMKGPPDKRQVDKSLEITFLFQSSAQIFSQEERSIGRSASRGLLFSSLVSYHQLKAIRTLKLDWRKTHLRSFKGS